MDPFYWAVTDETPKLKLKKPETELLSEFELEVDEVLSFEAAMNPSWLQDEQYSRTGSGSTTKVTRVGFKMPGGIGVNVGRETTADKLERQDESDEDEESI